MFMIRPPVKGLRDEQDALAQRWNSGQKPAGDERGDPRHAGGDEKKTTKRDEEHCPGGDEVRTQCVHTYP